MCCTLASLALKLASLPSLFLLPSPRLLSARLSPSSIAAVVLTTCCCVFQLVKRCGCHRSSVHSFIQFIHHGSEAATLLKPLKPLKLLNSSAQAAQACTPYACTPARPPPACTVHQPASLQATPAMPLRRWQLACRPDARAAAQRAAQGMCGEQQDANAVGGRRAVRARRVQHSALGRAALNQERQLAVGRLSQQSGAPWFSMTDRRSAIVFDNPRSI